MLDLTGKKKSKKTAIVVDEGEGENVPDELQLDKKKKKKKPAVLETDGEVCSLSITGR
jgi:hypothetical protein